MCIVCAETSVLNFGASSFGNNRDMLVYTVENASIVTAIDTD